MSKSISDAQARSRYLDPSKRWEKQREENKQTIESRRHVEQKVKDYVIDLQMHPDEIIAETPVKCSPNSGRRSTIHNPTQSSLMKTLSPKHNLSGDEHTPSKSRSVVPKTHLSKTTPEQLQKSPSPVNLQEQTSPSEKQQEKPLEDSVIETPIKSQPPQLQKTEISPPSTSEDIHTPTEKHESDNKPFAVSIMASSPSPREIDNVIRRKRQSLPSCDPSLTAILDSVLQEDAALEDASELMATDECHHVTGNAAKPFGQSTLVESKEWEGKNHFLIDEAYS
eukprot:TRINITY_DN7920_c0_g1_i1.p1 TRINITY_DN7920_c0_g1~~TRINITY_DN7920_c0_g1_i1.p1  ORF type:complete len:281 (-),score=66.45 TRINITY_DN7920_c0_g1_i1:770-1612(-)